MISQGRYVGGIVENRLLEELHAGVLDVGFDGAPRHGWETCAKAGEYGLMMPRLPAYPRRRQRERQKWTRLQPKHFDERENDRITRRSIEREVKRHIVRQGPMEVVDRDAALHGFVDFGKLPQQCRRGARAGRFRHVSLKNLAGFRQFVESSARHAWHDN